MTRSKTIEIDGRAITMRMMTVDEANAIEDKYRLKHLSRKKYELMGIIESTNSQQMLEYAKSELNRVDDLLSKAGQDAGTDIMNKMIMADAEISKWIREDEVRYQMLENEVMNYRLGVRSALDTIVEVFINKCQSQGDLKTSYNEVIQMFNDIKDIVMSGEDKKK